MDYLFQNKLIRTTHSNVDIGILILRGRREYIFTFFYILSSLIFFSSSLFLLLFLLRFFFLLVCLRLFLVVRFHAWRLESLMWLIAMSKTNAQNACQLRRVSHFGNKCVPLPWSRQLNQFFRRIHSIDSRRNGTIDCSMDRNRFFHRMETHRILEFPKH